MIHEEKHEIRTAAAGPNTESCVNMQELKSLTKDELIDQLLVAAEGLAMLDNAVGSVGRTKKSEDFGCFGYIAYDPTLFLAKMRQARQTLAVLKKTNKVSFLDVGCGVGTKVFLASRMFEQADGLEFDHHYHSAAVRAAKANHMGTGQFIKGDALKFRRFGDYDVIYLYRPFLDLDKQRELERKIVRDAKPDAVIVAPKCDFEQMAPKHRPTTLFEDVFLKCDSPSRGRRIRKLAEAMRPELVGSLDRRLTRKLRSMLELRKPKGAKPISRKKESNGSWTFAIDRALDRLTQVSPRQAELATFRLYAGVSLADAATLVGVSTATAQRDWEMAKKWIRSFVADWNEPKELEEGPSNGAKKSTAKGTSKANR